MNDAIRELNDAELEQIAGGFPIPSGGGSPVVGVGGGGRDFVAPGTGDDPYIGVGGDGRDPKGPILGGGSDWWILPGDLNPIIPVPKPGPGKP